MPGAPAAADKKVKWGDLALTQWGDLAPHFDRPIELTEN